MCRYMNIYIYIYNIYIYISFSNLIQLSFYNWMLPQETIFYLIWTPILHRPVSSNLWARYYFKSGVLGSIFFNFGRPKLCWCKFFFPILIFLYNFLYNQVSSDLSSTTNSIKNSEDFSSLSSKSLILSSQNPSSTSL